MKRLLPLATVLAWSVPALAEEPRIHVAAGGAHALGGSQAEEFAIGGVGTGTIELPAASHVGVQASAGALALAKGDPPTDPTIQPKGTGAAFLGTVGVRLRAYGATRVAGPWMDSNVGLALTGDLTRTQFDAHLGWEVRVSRSSRIDVGPFLGYAQIFQPDRELRPSDARIISAGLTVSLGAPERARPAEPVQGPENPLPPPPPPDPVATTTPEAEAVAAIAPCGQGQTGTADCAGNIRVDEDRIQLDDVVYFDFDSARISARSHELVKNVARFVNDHSELTDISIEGHADEIGSEVYNQRLSEARAVSMRGLLIRFGVDGSRLRVVAHGTSRPKRVTAKREAENRRVELYVTRPREIHAERESGSPIGSHTKESE